jgi:hypothetical protein
LSGRVALSDYVLNPALERWMYVRELGELSEALTAQKGRVDAEMLNRTRWELGCLGLLLLVLFPPAGMGLLIIAVCMSAFYYVKRVRSIGRRRKFEIGSGRLQCVRRCPIA